MLGGINFARGRKEEGRGRKDGRREEGEELREERRGKGRRKILEE